MSLVIGISPPKPDPAAPGPIDTLMIVQIQNFTGCLCDLRILLKRFYEVNQKIRFDGHVVVNENQVLRIYFFDRDFSGRIPSRCDPDIFCMPVDVNIRISFLNGFHRPIQ
jgi:hypothetical protein